MYGCTDPEAYNYNPEVTTDDDSCVYAGCTDPSAYNYNIEASIDDGSCGDVSEECDGPFPEGDVPFNMVHVAPGDFIYQEPTIDNSGSGEGCPSYVGDVNSDGGYNVLDVVAIANCVLAGDCGDGGACSMGDTNGDGNHNVLDIVAIANCVLAGECGDGFFGSYCDPFSNMTTGNIYYNSADGNVYINSDVEIAGFQFEIVGSQINPFDGWEVEGGAAEAVGFTGVYSSSMCLGFSLNGATIPPMNGVLVHLDLSSPETASITNVILSDQSGCAILDYLHDSHQNGFATIDCNYEIMK